MNDSVRNAPVAVTTWYLEMREPGALKPARAPRVPVRIERVGRPSPAFSRFLYISVGGDWHWRDRLPWSHARWMQHLDRPQVETWVAYVEGAPAGYVELEKQAGGDVDIAYFGVTKPYFGLGLGGHLLTKGIERAWAMGAKRVWVHTCTLDHPAALHNYQARGMEIFKTTTHAAEMPPQPPGPWPGAYE